MNNKGKQMKLEIGNVVQLKSGGPKMTVDDINYGGHDGLVRCVWFAENEIRFTSFSENTLEIVAPIKQMICAPVYPLGYGQTHRSAPLNDPFFIDYD